MDVFSTTEIKNTTIIEENFFNLHRSADLVENALVNFIKRKNDSLHFIAKTVKQIGYPRWDKIINFKQKQKPTSKIENEGAQVFYVPFVRDNQNYVNASMVISVNQTDTAFYYLCDWQYKNRVHGSSQIDSTAEKYALFFMWLNNRSLGYKSFNITDSSLFLTMGSSGAKKITILEKNTDSMAANNMYTYFEECTDIYYCGTPDYCDNQPNGCDYLSGCGLCQKIYDICYSGWFDDGSTGGGENGGTGNNPPGIPPGNGGNAGSGGTPPDPCNGTPNNPAPFAKGNNPNESNVVDPCEGGGGGWEPIEDEPIDNSIMVNYLTATLNLSIAEANFLTQHSILTQQIYNYISLNYSDEVKEIGKDHITKLVTDNNYLNFVNGHSATGNNQNVWWQDFNWLDNPLNFNLDITRVTNQYDELTHDEKILIAIYPLQAFTIKNNIQEAYDAADATGLPDPLNGKQDAFRHAFFQAINTRDVPPRLIGPNALSGSVIVSMFAFAHESEVPSLLHLEKEMDLFNNNVGISYCISCSWLTSNNSISSAIMTKLNNGELKYLKNVEPTPDPAGPNPNGINNNFYHVNGNSQLATHGITADSFIAQTNL